MIYNKKRFLILNLSLVTLLSVLCAVIFSFGSLKSVNAATSTTDGVYTLSDLNDNKLSSIAFTDGDNYTIDSSSVESIKNILNDQTKVGIMSTVNNSATLQFNLNYSQIKGTLNVVFTQKSCIDKNIVFQIALVNKKIKIGSINSSGFFSSADNSSISSFLDSCDDNSFMCTCSVSTKSTITLSGKNDVCLTADGNIVDEERFDVYLYHNSTFKDATIEDAYYKVSTSIIGDDGNAVPGDTLKVTKGGTISCNDLATPDSYTLNGDTYVFDYWSVDGVEYVFTNPVTSSFTLVAQYKKTSQIEGSITVVDSEGNTLQSFIGNEINGMDSKLDKTSIETSNKKIKGFLYEGNLYQNLSDVPFTNNTDITVTVEMITVYMLDGASVRLAEPAGIRFRGGASIDCVEYGMFLTAKDYLSEIEDNMTFDYLQNNCVSITSLNENMQKSINDEKIAEYAIVLNDIKLENYGVDFVARSFVKVKYCDNIEKYIYSDFSFENNSRSIHNVANMAMKDFDGSNEVLQKYIDGVIELKEENGEITIVSNDYRNYDVEITKEEKDVTITVKPKEGISGVSIGSIILNGKLKSIDQIGTNQYKISYNS